MENKTLVKIAGLLFSIIVIPYCVFRGISSYEHQHRSLVIEIKGPQAILLGDTATYYLSIVGQHGLPRWDFIAPPEESANESSLKPVDSLGSLAVEFTPVGPGDHILIAAVGGPGDQSIPTKKRITVVDPNSQPEPEPDPNEPVPGPPGPDTTELLKKLLQMQQGVSATPPTASDRLRPVLGNIHSDTYDQDKKVVFSCIQSLIGRISTGLVSPETDVIHELEIETSNSLGEKYDHWKPFFQELRVVVDILRQQGTITSASTYVPLLAEVRLLLR